MNEGAKLAVLIDADNASASVVEELLQEIAKFGTASIKRAYDDWTTQNLMGWKEHLHRHAIQPIQQFAYTTTKNSTDASLIIDAMVLVYAGIAGEGLQRSRRWGPTWPRTILRSPSGCMGQPSSANWSGNSRISRVRESTDASGFAHLSVRAR